MRSTRVRAAFIALAAMCLIAASATMSAAQAAPRSNSPTLVFASYNVCKTDCPPPAPPWDIRRDRIARTIIESSVDVVGLQEVTHWPTTNAKTQYLDVVNLLAPAGFVAPVYTPESDECRWTAENPHDCTHTTGIVFRAAAAQQITTPNGTASAGTLPMSRIASGLSPDSAPRKVAWAYLKGTNGAGPFLVLSAHTSTIKDAANEASRIAFGASLDGFVQMFNEAHGMTGTPAVLLADLNSYNKRQPEGVQKVLTNGGWLDAATAPVKRNVVYSTINCNPLLPSDTQGFPVRPYVFHPTGPDKILDATRIDYIMAKGDGLELLDYEVVIRLNPDGTFDQNYQGSDHQMVRATIAIPAR